MNQKDDNGPNNATWNYLIKTRPSAGSSLKELIHFAQEAWSGNFAAFDYGSSENMKRYGQSTPPIYDLKQIANIPIALFVGD